MLFFLYLDAAQAPGEDFFQLFHQGIPRRFCEGIISFPHFAVLYRRLEFFSIGVICPHTFERKHLRLKVHLTVVFFHERNRVLSISFFVLFPKL